MAFGITVFLFIKRNNYIINTKKLQTTSQNKCQIFLYMYIIEEHSFADKFILFGFCSDKKKKKKRLIENEEDEEAGVTNPSMVSMTGSNDHEHIKCKIINIADV